MNHLVLGMGQIGTAVFKVLKEKYTVYGLDKNDIDSPELDPSLTFDFLHIAFPYSDKFISEVQRYKKLFGNAHTIIIIHSTVPVGTTDQIDNAVHSPVRGIHPDLIAGIKTFVKFFGGKLAKEAAKVFEDLGIKTLITKSSKSVEAMKLWDTTIYGVNIALEKWVYDFCQQSGLDFNIVYTESCKSYNDGYEQLGHPEYKKYLLTHVPGKIGGHCVTQNLSLLDIPEITKFVLREE